MYTLIEPGTTDINVFPNFEKLNYYWQTNLYDKYTFFKHSVYISVLGSDITFPCISYVYIPNNDNLFLTKDQFDNEIIYIDNCITCFSMNDRFYTIGSPEKVPISFSPFTLKPITQKEFIEVVDKSKQYINNECSPIFTKQIQDLKKHEDIKSYKNYILDHLDLLFKK